MALGVDRLGGGSSRQEQLKRDDIFRRAVVAFDVKETTRKRLVSAHAAHDIGGASLRSFDRTIQLQSYSISNETVRCRFVIPN